MTRARVPSPLAAAAAAGLPVLVARAGRLRRQQSPSRRAAMSAASSSPSTGKNIEAVAALESFIRHNPTDSLAAEAQYLKAMTYMDMKEYPLAAVEFQILRKDYPTSHRVEDAYFQEGVAYLEQVGRIERDITGAYEARLHFLKFSQRVSRLRATCPRSSTYMQEISDLMVAQASGAGQGLPAAAAATRPWP